MPKGWTRLKNHRCKYTTARQLNTFYEVEKVLAKRIRNGFEEYFVKWSRYGSKANSWTHDLPSSFRTAWDQFSNKPFLQEGIFDRMVDHACDILATADEC
jgi:hypothetical protein